jgi:hypothetical protein
VIILLVISWSITLLVTALAAWLFIRYGRLLLKQSSPTEPMERQRPPSSLCDVAISLGGWCAVAYQLGEHGYRTVSYPFDWIVTPVSALLHLLKHDFDGFLDRGDLWRADGQTYIENSLGLKFFHDFHLTESFLSEYESVKEKYDRRTARFREVLDSVDRVAFVRVELSRPEAEQLRDLIRRKYPRLEFLLVVINRLPDGADDWGLDQVRNFSIEGVGDDADNWLGNNDDFGTVFEALPLTRLVKLEEVAHAQ